MGLDLSIHVGPYLSVPESKLVTEVKIKRVCPKHQTVHPDAKYCPECGTEIQNVEFEDKKDIYTSQLLWSLGWKDALYSVGGLDVLLPNAHAPNQIGVDLEINDIHELNDVDELIAYQKLWFQDKYGPIIQDLKKEFGDEEVIIKWGIITHWC